MSYVLTVLKVLPLSGKGFQRGGRRDHREIRNEENMGDLDTQIYVEGACDTRMIELEAISRAVK